MLEEANELLLAQPVFSILEKGIMLGYCPKSLCFLLLHNRYKYSCGQQWPVRCRAVPYWHIDTQPFSHIDYRSNLESLIYLVFGQQTALSVTSHSFLLC